MKHFLQIALVGTFLTSQVFAQSMPESEHLKALPADKILGLYMDNVEHREVQEEILRSIFQNERIDIVAPFFKKPYTRSGFLNAVYKLPQSAYKNKIVLVMLREDSVFWRYEGPIYDGSYGATSDNAVEPFVGVIRRYLPDLVINDELFATKAGRLKLAEDLETAMATSELGTTEQELPPDRSSDSALSTEVLTKSDSVSVPVGSDSRTPPKIKSWSIPLMLAAGISLALVLLRLIFKKRKSDSRRP